MPRRLVVVGIVIMTVGLASLAYLDPVIRIIFFGASGSGLAGGGASSFTRTGFAVTVPGANFSNDFVQRGPGGGTTSLASLGTIIVFVATVIGLLLTIAGSFAAGKTTPSRPGPTPAAKSPDSQATTSEPRVRYARQDENRY